MSHPLIIFSHGLESGPWGSKIQRLAQTAQSLGCDIHSIDYQGTRDPEARVQMLEQSPVADHQPLILVGSSMGAYVSLRASQKLKPIGLFLLAPALALPGYAFQAPPPHADACVIVHGWQDEIIPASTVIDYAQHHQIALHLLKDSHRLIAVLDQVDQLFATYLQRIIRGSAPPAL